MPYEEIRQVAFHLMHREPVVKIGHFSQRVRGDQPDFHASRIGDVDEIEVGINITGTSVNPARSIGPALVGIGSNPGAVAQLWLFIIAPLIGAGAAGLLFRTGAMLDVPNKP